MSGQRCSDYPHTMGVRERFRATELLYEEGRVVGIRAVTSCTRLLRRRLGGLLNFDERAA